MMCSIRSSVNEKDWELDDLDIEISSKYLLVGKVKLQLNLLSAQSDKS